jgi:EAL and modified HD-GYP domain-containing signal transduction protein
MIFLGRQPIFDTSIAIYGYELLYRSSNVNRADFLNGNRATSSVLVNSFFEFGLQNIVGSYRAFINMPRDFIVGTYEIPIDSENIVLEILEDITFDDEIAESLKRLTRRGFTLCLDDFIMPDSLDSPFLDYVHMVKLELPAYTPEKLRETTAFLKKKNIRIIAEKVETRKDFEMCREAGCDFFQGYFFCRPNIIKTTRIPKNKLAIIRLIKKVHDPSVSFQELEELISQDVTLSYRILKYINSAMFSLRSRINSIKRALSYIGLNKLKQWIYIMSIADISDDISIISIIETSMVRSRMCELVAQSSSRESPSLFSTVGLFSTLDAVVGSSMEEVLKELPFSDDINNALLYKSGELGEVLQVAILMEEGNVDEAGYKNISSKKLGELYIDAIKWVNKNMNEIFG